MRVPSVPRWGKLALLFALPSILALSLLSLIETIPPRDFTITRMGVTEVRLRAYWTDHGRLPERLEELAPLKGRDNSTTDGWGRAIQYMVIQPSTVTLTSLGAGGEKGPDQKIEITFSVGKPLEN